MPQLCCAVKSGFGRGGWQSLCSSHTWCYAQNEKEYEKEKEKEKDLKAGRYTNLSLSRTLSRNFGVPAMTIGINKRETLLYKLTDRLPNPDLTAQHSCGKGGLGWGPMTAERREFSHFLSSATRTSPDFVIQDIILSILCILLKKFNGIGDSANTCDLRPGAPASRRLVVVQGTEINSSLGINFVWVNRSQGVDFFVSGLERRVKALLSAGGTPALQTLKSQVLGQSPQPNLNLRCSPQMWPDLFPP